MSEEQYKQLMEWISECVSNVQIMARDDLKNDRKSIALLKQQTESRPRRMQMILNEIHFKPYQPDTKGVTT